MDTPTNITGRAALLGAAVSTHVTAFGEETECSKAIEDAANDIALSKALVKAAWLALMSDCFDPTDASDVADVVYEALHKLEAVCDRILPASEKDLKNLIDRRVRKAVS